jgi:hypothetical protein
LPSRDTDVDSEAVAPVLNNCVTDTFESNVFWNGATSPAGAPENSDVAGSRRYRPEKSKRSFGSYSPAAPDIRALAAAIASRSMRMEWFFESARAVASASVRFSCARAAVAVASRHTDIDSSRCDIIGVAPDLRFEAGFLQPQIDLLRDASPERRLGRDERRDLGVGQMRTALEQFPERPVRVAQKHVPELLVGHQPANHHLDAALRHRSSAR